MAALHAAQPFLAGAIAGVTATTVIQPMDFIKTRLQLAGEGVRGPSTSPLSVIASTYKSGGIPAFYAGLSAAWLRQIVYGSTRLGLFRVVSDAAARRAHGEPLPFVVKLAIGLTTGGFAAFFGNPADLALVRMQADSALRPEERRNYRGVGDALTRVVREEGVAALWRGSTPTMARAAALNMAMLATADQLKEALAPYLGGQHSLPVLLTSSAVAGVAAAVASLPFDMLKTRLQKQKALPDGTLPYTGLLDAAKKVVGREGPLALYKGLPTYILRVGPHSFIALITLDAASRWLGRVLPHPPPPPPPPSRADHSVAAGAPL